MDTSAAIEFVLNKENSSALGNLFTEADWILAPTLYCSEITNVLWKYVEFNNVSIAECEHALSKALELPDEYIADRELAQEAFSMACFTKNPSYDMFFLILARRNSAMLVTMDNKLKKLAKKFSIKTY